MCSAHPHHLPCLATLPSPQPHDALLPGAPVPPLPRCLVSSEQPVPHSGANWPVACQLTQSQSHSCKRLSRNSTPPLSPSPPSAHHAHWPVVPCTWNSLPPDSSLRSLLICHLLWWLPVLPHGSHTSRVSPQPLPCPLTSSLLFLHTHSYLKAGTFTFPSLLCPHTSYTAVKNFKV